MADASTTVWFPDETGRNDQESAFLGQLRQLAATWQVEGLSPQDTSSGRWLVPLYIDLDIPGVTIRRRTLQVAYWTRGPYGQALHGVWGDHYLMDDHDGNDPEGLTVVGVRATPQLYATWTAEWLLRQLHRPVIRHEWLRRGRVATTTWRLNDTGRLARQDRLHTPPPAPPPRRPSRHRPTIIRDCSCRLRMWVRNPWVQPAESDRMRIWLPYRLLKSRG